MRIKAIWTMQIFAPQKSPRATITQDLGEMRRHLARPILGPQTALDSSYIASEDVSQSEWQKS